MSFRLHSLARPSLLSTLLTLTMAPSDLFPLYPIIIPLDHTPPHPQPKFITGRFVFILAFWPCFILIYAFCILFCFLLFNSVISCAFFLSINYSPFCHHYYGTCLSSFNTLHMFFCRQLYEYFACILLALIFFCSNRTGLKYLTMSSRWHCNAGVKHWSHLVEQEGLCTPRTLTGLEWIHQTSIPRCIENN